MLAPGEGPRAKKKRCVRRSRRNYRLQDIQLGASNDELFENPGEGPRSEIVWDDPDFARDASYVAAGR
jgi:hypothetical protein